MKEATTEHIIRRIAVPAIAFIAFMMLLAIVAPEGASLPWSAATVNGLVSMAEAATGTYLISVLLFHGRAEDLTGEARTWREVSRALIFIGAAICTKL